MVKSVSLRQAKTKRSEKIDVSALHRTLEVKCTKHRTPTFHMPPNFSLSRNYMTHIDWQLWLLKPTSISLLFYILFFSFFCFVFIVVICRILKLLTMRIVLSGKKKLKTCWRKKMYEGTCQLIPYFRKTCFNLFTKYMKQNNLNISDRFRGECAEFCRLNMFCLCYGMIMQPCYQVRFFH